MTYNFNSIQSNNLHSVKNNIDDDNGDNNFGMVCSGAQYNKIEDTEESCSD